MAAKLKIDYSGSAVSVLHASRYYKPMRFEAVGSNDAPQWNQPGNGGYTNYKLISPEGNYEGTTSDRGFFAGRTNIEAHLPTSDYMTYLDLKSASYFEIIGNIINFPRLSQYIKAEYYGSTYAAATEKLGYDYQSFVTARDGWYTTSWTSVEKVKFFGENGQMATVTTDEPVTRSALLYFGEVAFQHSSEVVGSIHADTFEMGTGNSFISGGGGNDTIIGGSGNDTIYGVGTLLRVSNETGDNEITGGGGYDTIEWAGEFTEYKKELNTDFKSFFLNYGDIDYTIRSNLGSDTIKDDIERLVFAGQTIQYAKIQASAGFKWALDNTLALVKFFTGNPGGFNPHGNGPVPPEYQGAVRAAEVIVNLIDKAIEVKDSPNPYKALFVQSCILFVDAAQLYTDTVAPFSASFTAEYYDKLKLTVRSEASFGYDKIMASTLPVSEALGEAWGDLWQKSYDKNDPKDLVGTKSQAFEMKVKPVDIDGPKMGPLSHHNFNGDHTSDILLQTGPHVAQWTMHEGMYQSGKLITSGAGGFLAKGAGDFNGDGTSDILMQKGGTVVTWMMKDGDFLIGKNVTDGAIGYQVRATGDFNGDGTTDIALQNGGSVVVWAMANGAYASGKLITDGAGSFQVVGSGDFDGDGTSDLLLQNGGSIVAWFMRGGSFLSGTNITDGAGKFVVKGVGDFNGDGTSDFVMQKDGTVVDVLMRDGNPWQVHTITDGATGFEVKAIGDYNGDGTDDIVLQNGGVVVNWIMQDGQYASGNVVTTGLQDYLVV